MDLHEEKDLISRARRDPEAFSAIYDEYYPKILGYVSRRTANIEVAQDITSETFLTAIRKLWQFRWRNVSFSSWLFKIAVNEVNQYFRKGKYRSASLDELLRLGFDPMSPRDLEEEAIAAQERLERHQQFLFYQQQIGRLDIKYQEVIALRFFEHKEIREIGEILGKSDGTIKSLIHRGLAKLRGSLSTGVGAQPVAAPRIVNDEGWVLTPAAYLGDDQQGPKCFSRNPEP